MNYDEDVVVECPVCGAEQIDNDGFGVVYCEKCGYCQHLTATDGICDICYANLRKLELAEESCNHCGGTGEEWLNVSGGDGWTGKPCPWCNA